MNRQTIPINEIIVLDRQRLDLGDIPDLANSISRYGLIQPLVINQDKRLIAGGRRLAAHIHLGRSHVDCVIKETLTTDELHELELEENVRRKEMSWQEKCLNIHQIHKLKSQRSAIEGAKWGLRETGEMLGIAYGHVRYNNEIAIRLLSEQGLDNSKRRYWLCDTMSDAWKLRLRDEEALLQESLSKDIAVQSQQSVQTYVDPEILTQFEVDLVPSLEDLLSNTQTIPGLILTEDTIKAQIALLRQTPYIKLTKEQAQQLYLANPCNKPDTFDNYYKSKMERFKPADDIVYISNKLHNRSCIDFMNDPGWAESVDHIITDPPYGIEMDMLSQQNSGMSNVDTVATEHDVKENEELFIQFFPAAYSVLKPNGFLVLWCDIMQWQRLYNLAISAGFKVQRWPITWVKSHRCMNQSAAQNFTKTTEIAMVCRKGTATLSTMSGDCHIIAPHDEYKETLGHPFVKPYAVWEYLIDHISYERQTILEPFAGRGSGVLSILKKKRHFYACEINSAHYNALIENIKQHYLNINPNFTFK